MIGRFEEKCLDVRFDRCPQRIAFIWEITVNNNKISKIKVISDVSNPHMNELIFTKQYKDKFNKEILVPAYFPFRMTHVSGEIIGENCIIL
jgi:hypothetical protein